MNKLVIKRYKLNQNGRERATYINRIWLEYLNFNYKEFMRDNYIDQNCDVNYNQLRKQFIMDRLMDNYHSTIIYAGLEVYIEFETSEDMMEFILEWS